MTLPKVLDLVRRFRKADKATPIVLMGSYNPIHAYGTARFAKDAAEAGVDGLLIVDLPPEEDEVLRAPAPAHGLDVVRFVTPTSDDARLDDRARWRERLSLLRLDGRHHRHQDLSTRGDVRGADRRASRAHARFPCTVGFGIRTPEQAARVARFADGVVVGSAIVAAWSTCAQGQDRARLVANVTEFCAALAEFRACGARQDSVVG